MPYSSNKFLAFKWWRFPGIDFAIWVCQDQYNENDKTYMKKLINSQTDIDWSTWLVKLLQIGRPSIMDRLKKGEKNIWLTKFGFIFF